LREIKSEALTDKLVEIIQSAKQPWAACKKFVSENQQIADPVNQARRTTIRCDDAGKTELDIVLPIDKSGGAVLAHNKLPDASM